MKILNAKSKDSVNEAKEALKSGKVIIVPTDTVYGLVADATNKKAVYRLFQIKKRDKKKPIPIFVKNLKMARRLAYVDKKQEKFIKSVWPGRVTVVLKRKKNNLPKILFGGKNTIGLRIPKYDLINKILNTVNSPLTGTSANISGKPASTKIDEIISQFVKRKDQPDFILSVGNLPKNLPSTIIDLTSKKFKILRK